MSFPSLRFPPPDYFGGGGEYCCSGDVGRRSRFGSLGGKHTKLVLSGRASGSGAVTGEGSPACVFFFVFVVVVVGVRGLQVCAVTSRGECRKEVGSG